MLLRKREGLGRHDVVGSVSSACAAKLRLHHVALMRRSVVHRHHARRITWVALIEILLLLDFLVLLVACLTLVLGILLRLWWAAIA